MDFSTSLPPPPDPRINVLVYYFLPPEEAHWQFQHINDTKVTDVLVSFVVCLVLALAAVILRFCSRRLKGTKCHSDDWLMLPALISVAGYFTTVIIAAHRYGLGRHVILSANTTAYAKVNQGALCTAHSSFLLHFG